MKFDSSAIPMLPTPLQVAELNDLLVTASELFQVYTALGRHPRVAGSPRSEELFASFVEQVNQDIAVLDEQLEALLTLARTAPLEAGVNNVRQDEASFAEIGGSEAAPAFHFIPDTEPNDSEKSVFETVRKAFHLEDFFRQQLQPCLGSAQQRKHLKLELQLKMIILSAEQRCRLLEDRYGFARSRLLLFQGLRRQTTRFLSALSGDKRTDIDR